MAIIDSGSTADMCCNKVFFSDLHLFKNDEKHNRIVILGDGKTSVSVDGIGTIDIFLNKKRIIKQNVFFVKDLADTLISIKAHIKFNGCEVWSNSNTLYLGFPNGFLASDMSN